MPSFEERVFSFLSKNDKAVFGRRLTDFESSVASRFLVGYHEQLQPYFEKNDSKGLELALKNLAPTVEKNVRASREGGLVFVLNGFKGLDSAKPEKISEALIHNPKHRAAVDAELERQRAARSVGSVAVVEPLKGFVRIVDTLSGKRKPDALARVFSIFGRRK